MLEWQSRLDGLNVPILFPCLIVFLQYLCFAHNGQTAKQQLPGMMKGVLSIISPEGPAPHLSPYVFLPSPHIFPPHLSCPSLPHLISPFPQPIPSLIPTSFHSTTPPLFSLTSSSTSSLNRLPSFIPKHHSFSHLLPSSPPPYFLSLPPTSPLPSPSSSPQNPPFSHLLPLPFLYHHLLPSLFPHNDQHVFTSHQTLTQPQSPHPGEQLRFGIAGCVPIHSAATSPLSTHLGLRYMVAVSVAATQILPSVHNNAERDYSPL